MKACSHEALNAVAGQNGDPIEAVDKGRNHSIRCRCHMSPDPLKSWVASIMSRSTLPAYILVNGVGRYIDPSSGSPQKFGDSIRGTALD